MHEHELSEADLTLPEGFWSLTLVGVDMVFGCSTISQMPGYSNADGIIGIRQNRHRLSGGKVNISVSKSQVHRQMLLPVN